ncbi:hypothetical protein LTR08_003395 [Meristemomyces frigidus]|nr:hypothetical protein LTR08_003395 [Meristemomyces frigidus]
MASAKSLQDLPTDLIRDIADLLALSDLLRLRLSCRKIDDDTLDTVARRGFHYIGLGFSKAKASVSDLSRVLRSPKLASAVHICPAYGAVNGDMPAGELGRLLAKLSELKELRFDGIEPALLRQHFSLTELAAALRSTFDARKKRSGDGEGAAGAEPRALAVRLYQFALPSADMIDLVDAFNASGSLRTLALSYVDSIDRDWFSVLSAIKSLRLDGLQMDSISNASFCGLRKDNTRVNKGVRGAGGKIEFYWIRLRSMCMVGSMAVERGLEVVLGHLAEHERPPVKGQGEEWERGR